MLDRFFKWQRHSSLWLKIIIPVVGILGCIFGAYVYLSITLTTKQFVEQADRTALTVTAVLEKSLGSAMLSHRREDAHAILTSVGKLETIEHIALLDRDGKTVLKVGKGQNLNFSSRDIKPGIQKFQSGGGSYRVVRPIANLPKCHSCHGSSSSANGYLAVDISTREIGRQIDRNRYFAIGIGMLMAITIASAIALIVQIVARRPLHRLMATMSRVTGGDMSARAEVTAHDEIGIVSQHFNSMVQTISQKNDDLLAAERKIAQSERLSSIGLLAAGVAHEINNPLAGVSMSAEAILDGKCSPKQRENFVQMIIEETDGIREIVRRLLALDGTLPVALKSTDLNAIVNEALDSCLPALTANGVTADLDLSEGLPRIGAQASLLQQAIANIITNGAQAMQSGGRLTISTVSGNGRVKLTIADTGHGISKQDMSKIFDPFFTTKEVGEGFGLGLSVTYEIIHRHGADISVGSSPGEGTVFTINFPLFAGEENAHE